MFIFLETNVVERSDKTNVVGMHDPRVKDAKGLVLLSSTGAKRTPQQPGPAVRMHHP